MVSPNGFSRFMALLQARELTAFKRTRNERIDPDQRRRLGLPFGPRTAHALRVFQARPAPASNKHVRACVTAEPSKNPTHADAQTIMSHLPR
jgi:hypothetical protein